MTPRARAGRALRRLLVPTVLSAVVLSGCQSSEPDPPSGEPSSPSSEGSGAEAAATDEAVEPLAFGDNPLVQPCALLPVDTVAEVAGRLGPGTTARQDYLDRSMGEAEVRRRTDTLTRAVLTQCVYYVDGPGSESVSLEVQQFRNARDAEARYLHDLYLGSPKYAARQRKLAANPATAWLADLDGNELAGEPVRGEERMLYVPGFARWETWHDNLLLTFRYTDGAFEFEPQPLSPAEYRQQLPLAATVFDGARAALEEPVTRPVATTGLDGPVEAGPGVPYLDPCQVMDADVFEALHGRPDNRPAEVESLPMDTAAVAASTYTRAVPQECKRIFFGEPQDFFATLTLRTAPEAVEGVPTLNRTLAVTYYDEQPRRKWNYITAGRMQATGLLAAVPEDLGTPVAYLFDYQEPGTTRADDRTTVLYLVVGPYVVELDATTGIYRNVDAKAYARAGEVIVDNIERLAELEG